MRPFRADFTTEYSVRDVLTVLFKHSRTILTFFLATLAVVTLASYLLPPTYEATATILVNKARVDVPVGLTESPRVVISQLTSHELDSEIEILKSRQLTQDVLTEMGVNETSRPNNAWGVAISSLRRMLGGTPLTYRDELTLHLEKEVDVAVIRQSNMIRVSYRSNQPEWATRIVRTLTERYLELRTRVYQSPRTVSFFENQMQAAHARLTNAEQAVQDYLGQSGLTLLQAMGNQDLLSAQKETVLQKLAQFERGLGQVQALIGQHEDRIGALTTQLAGESERLPNAHGSNQSPTTDLDRTEINPIYRDLKTELLRAEADLGGARGQYRSLQQQVARYRGELRELNEKAFALEGLRRDVRVAEEAYLLYQKRHEEARISAAMEQQKLNVSIAQPAQRPLRPVAPRKGLNMVLAVFLGAFGGLGLAFLREYFDHSFTTGYDLERRLRLPHLASIPEEK